MGLQNAVSRGVKRSTKFARLLPFWRVTWEFNGKMKNFQETEKIQLLQFSWLSMVAKKCEPGISAVNKYRHFRVLRKCAGTVVILGQKCLGAAAWPEFFREAARSVQEQMPFFQVRASFLRRQIFGAAEGRKNRRLTISSQNYKSTSLQNLSKRPLKFV